MTRHTHDTRHTTHTTHACMSTVLDSPFDDLAIDGDERREAGGREDVALLVVRGLDHLLQHLERACGIGEVAQRPCPRKPGS